MIEYFSLTWDDSPNALVAMGSDDPSRDRLLSSYRSIITDWTSPNLEVNAEVFADYLPNNLGLRLCSAHMRHVVEHSVRRGSIEWLPAQVSGVSGVVKDYYVLHLPDDIDVLNEPLSLKVGTFVVKAVFDIEKLDSIDVLRIPRSILNLVVSSTIRDALIESSCTGVWFEPVPLA